MVRITEVIIPEQKGSSIPIGHGIIDLDDEPQPPELPVEPIHALQMFFFPVLLIFIFMSFIIAIVSNDYLLLLVSILALILPIVGRIVEKKYQRNRRKIAIGILTIEIGLYFIWEISCNILFGNH